MLGEADRPLTRLVELPGRGTTRVWECAGPPGAGTLMLIHGVAGTAELNWGKVFAPLGRHFRVVAADLRGHGDGIHLRSRFRLEDCADDVAALAGVLKIPRFAAVGYSMGGIVAQVLYRRHASLLSGLVLCSTAANARGSPAERIAALAVPAMAAVLQWNPMLHLMGAEFFGLALLGRVDDPATARWARAQLSRTTLATTISATHAVCQFTSDSWLSQVDVPTAVVITARDRVVPPGRQLSWPGRSRARRFTTWTATTGPASTRRGCSPVLCSRRAGQQNETAAARCGHRPDAPTAPRTLNPSATALGAKNR